MITSKEGAIRKRQKVPESLIYEVMDGKPSFIKGIKRS